jgi:acetylornithine deacetylase/succinyl-diaminopimelate desuccinylase-like protein
MESPAWVSTKTMIRAHGKDERLRVSSLDEGLEFFYLFLRAITGSAQ